MFDVKMVSEKIRDARIRKNMTQSNLADELGVSYQAVSNWERGNSLPDLSKYEDLCRILDVDLEYLLGIGADTDTVNRLLADGKGEAADVRVEEIASVAPLLSPDTLKEAVEASREKEAIRVEDLIALAPFLDRETLDRFAKDAIVNDIKTLVGIAPFVSRDTLAEMVRRADHIEGRLDMEFLMSIAPFLPGEILDQLAEAVNVDDLEKLAGIAPFVSRDTLAEMVRRADNMKGKVDMEFLISIAPFLPKDMVRKLAEGNLGEKSL